MNQPRLGKNLDANLELTWWTRKGMFFESQSSPWPGSQLDVPYSFAEANHSEILGTLGNFQPRVHHAYQHHISSRLLIE